MGGRGLVCVCVFNKIKVNLNKILPKISIYKMKEDMWKFSNLNSKEQRVQSVFMYCSVILLESYESSPSPLERREASSL